MTYVEGFVTAVPTANKERYIAHARQAAALVKEFGVARFVEGLGDDMQRGKVNDLWGAVQAKEDETVLFSWFEYPDKATRDAAANARMMEDPRMGEMGKDMPFDGSRMIYAGFDVVHEQGDGAGTGYVDAVVMPVTGDRAAYADYARRLAPAFLDNGALRVVDAIGDDVSDGKVTDFNRAIRKQGDELPGFGWIEWPSRAVRDAAWPKLEAHPAMAHAMQGAPFDMKRGMFGGFVPILDL
ncbi:DUF1428 domain-containing protein [Sphingomonas sp. MMS24-JH45]